MCPYFLPKIIAKTQLIRYNKFRKLKNDKKIWKETVNHVWEDCTAKRGSYQGTAQRAGSGQRRGNPQELLEAEAKKLIQAARYEYNKQRQGYRSVHYSWDLTTTSGEVTLKVPKLKGISFEIAIIERYRRQEIRRTRVVSSFLDGNAALMLVCAWLHHVVGTQWGNKKYINMKHLEAAVEDTSITDLLLSCQGLQTNLRKIFDTTPNLLEHIRHKIKNKFVKTVDISTENFI